MMRSYLLAGAAAFASGAIASTVNCSVAALSTVIPSNSSINWVEWLPENSSYVPDSDDVGFPYIMEGLPSLCIANVHVPTPGNTSYNFAVYLPDVWNGRFLTVGNAGFAGGIYYGDMGVGVKYGFAVVSSDLGHNSTAQDGTWAWHEPEKLVNWGYRALHGSIVLGKEITEAYYGEAPAYSYYHGCSTGGRQGLKEASMFPDDFDGIVAGAPAWWTTHLQLYNMYVGIVNLPTTADHYIPDALFEVISDEILKQCDPQDGLVDTVVSSPHSCIFDPWTLYCGPNVTNSSSCLSEAQIGTVNKLYNDWVEANQTFVFPHYNLGSELEFIEETVGPVPTSAGTDYVKYFLGLGPDWDWTDWNPSIIPLSDEMNPGNATVYDYDISPYYKKGGKLLHYHGLSDGSIPTGSSLFWHNQVLQTLKPKGIDLDDFYRFFLVPGMTHCGSTPSNQNAPWYFAGANQVWHLNLESNATSVHSVPGFQDSKHDVLLAMMSWVENGTAPHQIIATKWEDDATRDVVYRQRPFCKYPYTPVYSGTGDANNATNWDCKPLYGNATIS